MGLWHRCLRTDIRGSTTTGSLRGRRRWQAVTARTLLGAKDATRVQGGQGGQGAQKQHQLHLKRSSQQKLYSKALVVAGSLIVSDLVCICVNVGTIRVAPPPAGLTMGCTPGTHQREDVRFFCPMVSKDLARPAMPCLPGVSFYLA